MSTLVRQRSARTKRLPIFSVLAAACVALVVASGIAPAAAAEPGAPADHPVVLYLALPTGYTERTQADLEAQARDQFATLQKYWFDQSNGTVDLRLEALHWASEGITCGANKNAVVGAAKDSVGYTPAPRRHFIYVVMAGCPEGGTGSAGSGLDSSGMQVQMQQMTGTANGLWVHELGHNLSFGHAGVLYCTTRNAVDCETDAGEYAEYGDGADTMGASYQTVLKGFSAPNAIRVGFTRPDEFVNIEGSTTRTVTIRSRDIFEDGNGLPNLEAIRVTDPLSNRTYYVELASRDGYNAPIWWGGRQADTYERNGARYQFDLGVRVMRFMAPEGAAYQNTAVLPSPENAEGIRRTVWDPGTTFTSASGGTRITVVSVADDLSTATIQITTVADVTAPAAPAALISDGATVTGTAEPGATVSITDADGAVLGTATADESGQFAVRLATEQADGAILSAKVTDAAGNVSPPSMVTVDIPVPTAPNAAAALASDGAVVTGTAELGATVIVTDAAGVELGTATADAVSGAFTVQLKSRQPHGVTLRVTVRDAAGLTSPIADVDVVGPLQDNPDEQVPVAPPAAVSGAAAAEARSADDARLAATGATVGGLPLVAGSIALIGVLVIGIESTRRRRAGAVVNAQVTDDK